MSNPHESAAAAQEAYVQKERALLADLHALRTEVAALRAVRDAAEALVTPFPKDVADRTAYALATESRLRAALDAAAKEKP